MVDVYELDSLIACDDLQPAGSPLEADDALAVCRHGVAYDPACYMELSDSFRREIDAINRRTTV